MSTSSNAFFNHELARLDRQGEAMRIRVAPGAPARSGRILSGNIFINPELKRQHDQAAPALTARSRSAAGAPPRSSSTAAPTSAPTAAAPASSRRPGSVSARGALPSSRGGGGGVYSDPYFQQLRGPARASQPPPPNRSVAPAPSSASALNINLQQQQQQQQSQEPSQILQSRPIPGREGAGDQVEKKKKKLKKKKKPNAPDISAIERQHQFEEEERLLRAEQDEARHNIPLSARLSAASGLFRPEYQEEVMLSARGGNNNNNASSASPQRHHQQPARATSSHFYTRRPTNYGPGAAATSSSSPAQHQQTAPSRRSASAGSVSASVLYDSTSRPQPSSSTARGFTPRKALDAAFVRTDSNVAVSESGIPRRIAHQYNLREETETRIARCLRSGFRISDVPSADEPQELHHHQHHHHDHHHHHQQESSAAGATAFMFENNNSRSGSAYHRSASAATNTSQMMMMMPVSAPQGSAMQCFLEDPPPCTFAVSAGRKISRSQLNFISSPNNGARDASVVTSGGGNVSHLLDASTRRDLSIGISPRPGGGGGGDSRSSSAVAAHHHHTTVAGNTFVSSPSSHDPNSRSASAGRAPREEDSSNNNNNNDNNANSSSPVPPPSIITSPRYDRYDLFPTSSTLFKQQRGLVEAAEAVTRLTPEDFVDLYRNVFAAEDTERFRVPPLVSSAFAALAAAALHHREGDELEREGEQQQQNNSHTKFPSPIDFSECLSPLGDTDSVSEQQSRPRRHKEGALHQQQQQQQNNNNNHRHSSSDEDIFIPDDLSPEQQAQEYANQVAAKHLREQQQQHQQHEDDEQSAARQLNLTAHDDEHLNHQEYQHLSPEAIAAAPGTVTGITSSPRLRRIIDLNDMSPERYCLFTAAWSALWCLAVALDQPCIAAHRRYDQDLVLPRRPSLHELQSEFFGGTQLSVVGLEAERDPNFEPKVCTVATKVVAATVEFDKGPSRAHAVRLDTALRHATRWIAEAVKVREDIAAAYRSMHKRESEERLLSSMSPASDDDYNNNNNQHEQLVEHNVLLREGNSNSRSVSPRSPEYLPQPMPLPSQQQQQQYQRFDTARTNETVATTTSAGGVTFQVRRENSLEAALEQVRPFDGPPVLLGEGEEQTLQVAKTVLRWAVEMRDASVRLLK